MCIACIEFIKGTLTVKELRNGLVEMARDELTRDQEHHLIEVRTLAEKNENDPEELKKKLQGPRPKD